MPADTYGSLDIVTPAAGSADVVPADGADLAKPCKSLYVGTGGHVKVTHNDGSVGIYKNSPNGSYIFARVARVWATGTTATDILALY